MKAASLRKQVDSLKKMLESNADKWWDVNRSNIIKIIYKVLAFSQFDLNTKFFVTLFDSAIFVHIFNLKKRFLNFKKVLKGQCLFVVATLFLLKDGNKSHYP